MLESYLKVKTYANVGQKVSPVNKNNNLPDKYRTLIEKVMQLEPKNWLNFQKWLKKLHSVEICQTETQTNYPPRHCRHSKQPYHN